MRFSTTIIVSIAFLLADVHSSPTTSRVTLTTTLGEVTGIRKSVGADVSAVEIFYGIPFAAPPVGGLRFRPPVPAQPWGPDPLDGTVMPNACWQTIDSAFGQHEGVDMWNPNTNRSEDCLYLNVWRPASSTEDVDSGSGDGESGEESSHKTIMVWIFGGGFFAGSSTLDVYDASQLAARKDVIVVNIAYRVGAFGFFYLGNSTVPGNAGMLDQVMALQWVKDNAVNLGGSPDDITIFGESAGAVSVGFHLLSPLSRNLFNKAIMQSSTPLARWAVMDKVQAWDRSAELARHLGCQTPSEYGVLSYEDMNSTLACMQNIDPYNITLEQWDFISSDWFDVPYGPIVDGHFLPDHPESMLRRGDVKLTNVLLGVNKDEGIYFFAYAFQDIVSNGGKITESDFQRYMFSLANRSSKFREELIDTYSDEESGSHLDIVDGASGDVLFKCSVVDFARQYTEAGGNVYLYSFEENLSSNPWADWMGVLHGYEIEAVFGQPLAPGANNTQMETEFTQLVMELWTNFVKDGYPSASDYKGTTPRWPIYTTENKEYVILNSYGLRPAAKMREEQCKLWADRRRLS